MRTMVEIVICDICDDEVESELAHAIEIRESAQMG